MKKIDTIEKVSRIDILNDLVLLGVTSKELHGVMAVGGDKINIYKAGQLISSKQLDFVRFHSFLNGILFSETDGSPVYFSDFKSISQITDKNFYIKPLQNRNHLGVASLIETDEKFNQTYYILNNSLEKILLPRFPKILLNDGFICTTKNTVELFNYNTLNMCWRYKCDEGLQLDRRNKIFSDENLVYLPVKGGVLIALDVLTGVERWKWQGDAEYVSYGEAGNFVYVHAGNKIIILSKINGQIENVINYSDYNELVSFRANGIIWCFKQLLIVRNSGTGDLVVFNRLSFELIAREIVDTAGIPESKDCIRYVDGYLYVLSTSSKVHIYKIENNSEKIS